MPTNTQTRENWWLSLAVATLVAGCTGFVDGPQRPQGSGDGGPGAESQAGTGGGAGASSGSGAACGFIPQRIWLLGPMQITRTLQALVPGAPDVGRELAGLAPSTFEFSLAAEVQGTPPAFAAKLFETLAPVAKLAADQQRLATACLAEQPTPAPCIAAFVESFGKRAFRRPLTGEERAGYEKLFADVVVLDPSAGLEQVILALLMSPHALFRSELGAPDGVLTSHERAAAISYLLTDAPPDAELQQAADSGALATADELRREARRLLATPQSAAGLVRFLAEHLAYDSARNLHKDATRFPNWTPELGAAAAEETRGFVEQVLWQGDGQLSTLLTSTRSWVNGPLARLYGAAGVDGDAFVMAELPVERAGLLTHASFLAREAHEAESDAVKRGKFIASAWLCQPPPPPPKDVNAIPPRPDGVTTQRERLAVHGASPTCAGCHALMDPLGLALETYDAIGQWRPVEAGKTIDPSGFVTALASRPAFQNAGELSAILAQAPEVRACLATKLYRYAFGRRESSEDACLIDELGAAFSMGGGDVKELVVKLVASDAFVKRTLEVVP